MAGGGRTGGPLFLLEEVMSGPRPGFVRLIAPSGSWEGPTYGGEQYPIRADGTVDVPEEAAAPLLRTGGFALWAARRVSDDDE